MKRKLKWLAIVLAVSLLGFGTALFLWPRDRITVESWQKIRIGMTEDEVAEILGGPGMSWEEREAKQNAIAKNVGKDPFVPNEVFLYEPPLVIVGTDKYWLGPRGMIAIFFDQEQGHVCSKRFNGWRSDFWDSLRDWLGW